MFEQQLEDVNGKQRVVDDIFSNFVLLSTNNFFIEILGKISFC